MRSAPPSRSASCLAVDRRPERGASLSNAARAALIIPAHFGRDMARGRRTRPSRCMVDASDANTARLVAGYAGQITRASNRRVAGIARAEPVQAAIRLWYNPGRSSKKFYGPGIFVLGLSMFPPLLAALAMAREGEQKTILQVYVSSISAHEFLLGKILAFMAVALAECAADAGAALHLFRSELRRRSHAVHRRHAFSTRFAWRHSDMVGAAIPNQAAAMQAVALGGFLLVFLLSGLIFPIENIPAGLRWLSNFVWGRYYIEIVRDALLQGGGWPAVWCKVLHHRRHRRVFYAWRGATCAACRSRA